LKRSTIYIVLAALAIIVTIVLLTGPAEKEVLDERMTFSKDDKIPYGTWLAFNNLPGMFPEAIVRINVKEPGYWDSLSQYEDHQALVILSPRFYPDHYEFKKLLSFIENGNDVFVSTRVVSATVEEYLNAKIGNFELVELMQNSKVKQKPVAVKLEQPVFKDSNEYSYPGVGSRGWFYNVDTVMSDILGRDEKQRINFIHLKAGKGNLYMHLSPVAFTNYFLLQRKNLEYYESVFSLINPEVRTIAWDEYYLNKKNYYSSNDEDNEESKGFLAELFKYRELKWALLLASAGLLLYVLLEMRRRQRYIPVINPPKNDSLDFVRTIGRLYYEKGDHANLSRKMTSYFLEHVRSRYKLSTNNLNDNFIKQLQFKSGVDEHEIRDIVAFIQYTDSGASLTQKQVGAFHKQLENFYSKA
jgi:hypothetical protein